MTTETTTVHRTYLQFLFRHIFRDIQEGVAFLSQDGKVRHANRAWLTMVGGVELSQLPSSSKTSLLTQIRESRCAQPHTFTVVTQKETLSCTAAEPPEENEGVLIIAYPSVQNNATSAKRFDALFEKTFDCVYVHDLSGNILDANPAALRLLKYSRQDLIGLNLQALLKEKETCSAEFILEEVRKYGEERHAREYTITCKDGTEKRVEARYSLIYQDTVPVAVLGIARDITKHKRVESIQQEGKELFRSIFDNSDEIIYRTDMNGTITLANPSAIRILGYLSPQDLVGKNITQTVYANPDDRKKFLAVLERTGKVHHYEITLKRKDGQLVYVQTNSYYLYDKDGNKIGIEGIAHDITTEKNTQREKQHLESQLRKYSTQLERQIQRLEHHQYRLSENEKRVLCALVLYPNCNDRQLSDKINIKRSTITAIRERLKQKDMYRSYVIPDFRLLGCSTITCICGEFAKEYITRKSLTYRLLDPCLIWVCSTNTQFCALLASHTQQERNEKINSFVMACRQQNIISTDPVCVDFSLDNTYVESFLCFDRIMKRYFNVPYEISREHRPCTREHLTPTMLTVLSGLVRYPDEKTCTIAKIVNLARTTVTLTRQHLFERGILRKIIVPNIKKLTFHSLVITHQHHIATQPRMSLGQAESHDAVFLKMQSKHDSLTFSLAPSSEDARTFEKASDKQRTNDAAIQHTVRFALNDCKFLHIDIASLTHEIMTKLQHHAKGNI